MAKKKRAAAKKSSDTAANEVDTGTIEEAMEELETIVDSLESGQASLSESLQRFERGMLLLRHCHRQLEQSAQRIEVLAGVNDDGSVETAVFDGSATTGAPSGTGSSAASDDTTQRLF